MAEATEVAQAAATKEPKKVLSKEERSQVARDAAKRRWKKAKLEKSRTMKGKPASPKGKTAKSKSTPAFSSALKVAEKQLAKAIQDRQEAANKYAVASATIPSLVRIISALRNPNGSMPVPGEPPVISLAQIVGDEPLPYANPPRAVAAIPVPQALHPANQVGRAQGGAVGVELAEEADEDQFLKTSAVAGGEWH